MNSTSAAQLAELLQKHVLRIRTGIVLLDQDQLGQEKELIARLKGVGGLDIWSWKIEQLVDDTRYLGLSEESIVQDLHNIANDKTIPGNCVWVYNLDVLVSRLGVQERGHFWRTLLEHFRPTRGLIFSLPEAASNLMTIDERRAWERSERLAT